MDGEPGAIKFLGIHFKDEKQRKIVLISAFVGIVAFIMFLADKNKKAANGGGGFVPGFDPGAGNDSGGMVGGGTGGGSILDQISDQLTQIGDAIKGGTVFTPQSSIKFDYVQDTSSEFSASSEYSKGGGSSFSLGGAGYSLGFGSTSVTSRSGEFQATNRDIFSNQSELVGVSDAIIREFMEFSQTVGGTYDQRTDSAAARLQANEQLAQSQTNSVMTGKKTTGNITVEQRRRQTINGDSQSMSAVNTATI